jgi:hypothetical protein
MYYPGVYAWPTTLDIINDITLDAGGDSSAVFIFNIGTAMVVSGKEIKLVGGALAENVFWNVGSSATLGVGCTFRGTILAEVSITATGAGLVHGRLLARDGAVTLGATKLSLPSLQMPV